MMEDKNVDKNLNIEDLGYLNLFEGLYYLG